MPQFESAAALASQAAQRQCSIGQIVLEKEAQQSGISADEIYRAMEKRLSTMRASIREGLRGPHKTRGGMVGSMGVAVENARKRDLLPGGDLFNRVIARSLAIAELNAAMGKIVACPTAGSCGIVPACLLTVGDDTGASDEQLTMALFTLGGLGTITASRAPISGAAGGCQAECGVASAMAAAGVSELLGCSPAGVLDAASLALQHFIGLVCDPVGGLVEVPCVTRNAAAAVNALACANMVKAGVKSVIPFDEAVEAMAEAAGAMPESLRETAKGGIAATKTGKEIARRLADNNGME